MKEKLLHCLLVKYTEFQNFGSNEVSKIRFNFALRRYV